MAYEIRFAASVAEHIEALTGAERACVLDAIVRNLRYEPLVETRHRKPLRPNPVAPWVLRIGALRVFYEVLAAQPITVHVLAVGKKRRNVVRIGGREIRL